MPTDERSDLEWSPVQRVAFRFAALYFALYSLTNLPLPLGVIPIEDNWAPTLAWITEHVLGIRRWIWLGPSGSGDRTIDYVEVLTFVVLAGLGCLVWSLVDRERRAYPRLAWALTNWARYWLASYLLAYGMIKVLVVQFPYPDVVMLSATYAESTPMWVLWISVGISPLYSVFGGGVEVLAGLLLFARRTTTLGALISVGAMTNIVVLNFGYDVCVKLFSSHLLLLSLILAGLDGRRLLAVFVLNHPVPAREEPTPASPRAQLVARVLAGLYITANLVTLTSRVLEQRAMIAELGSPLYGLYEVVSHERDGERLTDERDRWRQVAIGRYDSLAIDPLHGPRASYSRVEVDVEDRTLTAWGSDGAVELHYQWLDDQTLLLEGTIGEVEHEAVMRVVDESELPLVNHGFQWIRD